MRAVAGREGMGLRRLGHERDEVALNWRALSSSEIRGLQECCRRRRASAGDGYMTLRL